MCPRYSTLVFLFVVGSNTGSAATISPSNLPAGFCDDVVVGDLTVGAGLAIDTSAACTLVLPQSGGPDLCVMRYANISVGPGGQISVSGARGLVLAAQGNFTVQGIIGAGTGPGGGFASGSNAANAGTGGGGAGGDAVGGQGGGNVSGTGGSGGPLSTNSRLVPLFSGGSGGSGAGGAIGGKGGIALELVACGTFTLSAGAVISSNGAGGSGGATGANGGGGGGGGGGVLIEGDNVGLAGTVTANGGGGGGGGGTTAAGLPGSVGGTGTIRASGGFGGNSGGGTGGLGGAGGLAPGNGTGAASSSAGGGGGGGSEGVIRVNSCSSQTINGALLSPPIGGGSNCNAIFANGFES